MKKLSICVLLLFCLLFISCKNNIFKETTISIQNKCAWELYLNVSGGDYNESFTVGTDNYKITIPVDVEYTITLTSPYDYDLWTMKTTPKFTTSKWTFEWSTYKAKYVFSDN